MTLWANILEVILEFTMVVTILILQGNFSIYQITYFEFFITFLKCIFICLSISWNNNSSDDLCLEQTYTYQSFQNLLQQGI